MWEKICNNEISRFSKVTLCRSGPSTVRFVSTQTSANANIGPIYLCWLGIWYRPDISVGSSYTCVWLLLQYHGGRKIKAETVYDRIKGLTTVPVKMQNGNAHIMHIAGRCAHSLRMRSDKLCRDAVRFKKKGESLLFHFDHKYLSSLICAKI